MPLAHFSKVGGSYVVLSDPKTYSEILQIVTQAVWYGIICQQINICLLTMVPVWRLSVRGDFLALEDMKLSASMENLYH